ncbi:UNVERIFIED_CONTAM: hypothetical protein FKN15_031529 [Acipenser sinensis]
MCATLVTVMELVSLMAAYYAMRLEGSVNVRDMCLADSAISASMDSIIYNTWTLMAAVLVTVIPQGR